MNMLDIIALAVVIIVALGGYAMGFKIFEGRYRWHYGRDYFRIRVRGLRRRFAKSARHKKFH